MNSLATLRWNHGGRNVSCIARMRGGKITKSIMSTAGRVRLRLQHEEDRRIGMVVADRADHVEAAQVVLVRREVAVPRDDVAAASGRSRGPQVAEELVDELEAPFAVLVCGDRVHEVARIGEAVRADRAQVGEAQVRAEVLADVAARLAIRQLDAEAHAARDDERFPAAPPRARPVSVIARRRPSCGTISSSPSASTKYRSVIERSRHRGGSRSRSSHRVRPCRPS